MWFMHDARLGCAFLFLDIMAVYIYICMHAINDNHCCSMSRVYSWNEVGDVLCQVSSSPFCAPLFANAGIKARLVIMQLRLAPIARLPP